MSLITVNFTPDINYSGTYTLKVYRQPDNTVTYSKNYNPPYPLPIIENITLSGINTDIVKITANDCNKIVYQQTLVADTYCGIPTNLRVSNITNNSANLAWSAPLNGTPSNGYFYEIYQGGTLVTSSNTLAVAANITGLTTTTLYKVNVYANCGTNILGTLITINFTTIT